MTTSTRVNSSSVHTYILVFFQGGASWWTAEEENDHISMKKNIIYAMIAKTLSFCFLHFEVGNALAQFHPFGLHVVQHVLDAHALTGKVHSPQTSIGVRCIEGLITVTFINYLCLFKVYLQSFFTFMQSTALNPLVSFNVGLLTNNSTNTA